MNMSKNSLLKMLAFMLIICMTAVVFTGCGEGGISANAYRSVSGKLIESGEIASNENYELQWDKDGRAIVLKSLKYDTYWSDILYDAFLDGSISANGNSPISITVANTKTLKWDTITSYSMLESGGNILCKQIDNGIRVTYFFEKYKIAIPVDYTLREDSLSVTVDSSKILEDGTDFKLVAVSVVPKLCSIKNDTEGGSLFVPSGSGAVMYTTEDANGTREYEGEVYGRDSARRNPLDLTDWDDIRIPVFGAYGGNSGLMGIIEEGAASCKIRAESGNSRLGYSSVGAVFYVRGYDEFSYTYHGKYKGITTRVTKNMSGQKFTVSYYPLYGEDADYSGIAKKYRNYLIEKGELKETTQTGCAYSVTVLGGTNITTSIFGIPNNKLVSMTTFSQAKEIIEDLNKKIGTMPYVRMMAYGDKGIRVGSVAGGKSYPSVFGKSDDIKSLNKLCKDTGLFFDYDIVYFSKSGSGFSLNFDVAKTAISYKAEHYPVNPLRVKDKKNVYYTIARDSLSKSADFAVKKAEKYEIDGISFSSLGYTAFSDTNYISKDKIESDVKAIIENSKSNRKVAVADANVYAACAADVIFDTATDNGDWDSLDLEVPFYQMVFHSYKPMFSSAVNLEENTDRAIAKAVAYGMGVGFTLTEDYVDKSDDLGEFRLYGTVYSDNADIIKELLADKGYIDVYSAIAEAQLVKYEIAANGLSTSEYSNGKIVYVNQSNTTVESPVGELEPYGFVIK